ncbi:hypothetical protein B7494_g4413 [Chlorociboria aeruginascens]|nr:hypothetical protein B7494_g4413 [Chlorociboria aeruginascens]
MGASESKLVFKQGIFKLSDSKIIPADDPYWASFWELPESSEDIFSLFSPADIRRTRDTALENLETLILAITSRLFVLRHHPSFPDPEFAPDRDALNCIRVLTRILPYVYEADHLQAWEEKFFWGVRRKRTRKASLARDVLFDESQEALDKSKIAAEEFEEVKPLAEELIDTLVDLLFFSDFTLPRSPRGKSKVSYAIWQSGVGCNTSIGTTREFESNRTEILRLLLTLTSQSMYTSATLLPVQGIKAVTYLVTCPDKQVVLSLLCSLLNTTLTYNPASWRVPYNVQVFKDPKQVLVTYALQFLLVLLLYPIPESGPAQEQKNYFRHFLGRLHRPQDFQFIYDGITRILNQPINSSTSYIPGSQTFAKCASEMIMLFWEITQCNKRFRSFIIDTNRSHDFLILILFYTIEYKLDTSKQGVVRMCVFLLQTMSMESNFGKNINKKFEAQETLPASIRIQPFNGSYADFLIHSIYNIITTSHGKLTAIYPALLAIINNIAAHLDNISVSASSKLLQLFSSMSSPGFLLSNDSNHDLLQSLLESMNAIIEHQFITIPILNSYQFFAASTIAMARTHRDVSRSHIRGERLFDLMDPVDFVLENPNFVYAVLRNKKRFESLRSFTLESGQEDIERRNRRRKEQTRDSADFSDNNRRESVDSIRSPSSSHLRRLSDVPEDGTFAIGDDEDEDTDDDHHPASAESTPADQPSQASSVSSSAGDAVPVQLRGMSEKARGKMPAGQLTFSRQNSTTSLSSYAGPGFSDGTFEPTAAWIDSWLSELPLHTILTLIDQLYHLLPRSEFTTDAPSPQALHIIQETPIRGIEALPIRIHSFEWSPLSLGWYESLLWSFVFVSEMQIAKGTVGVWNGTAIKLFRVQEVAAHGPTLSSPRGAVDAVGSNIVSRIGSINLRGTRTSQESQRESAGGGQGTGTVNRRSIQILKDIGEVEGKMERSIIGPSPPDEEVKSYKIHVSSKYLELTKKKLELTRLPHELFREERDEAADDEEVTEREWGFGTPKSVIEPLIDFWLEQYNWREQEAHLNTIPQYRTAISISSSPTPLRIHFLHIRSPHSHAVPLLLVPSFPLSNLSFQLSYTSFVDPTSPTSTQPFHLIIPSLPGLGFSDAMPMEEGLLESTAEIFDILMRRVGYEHYVASGLGSGRESPAGIDYWLLRLLGERYKDSCLGVHILDPLFEQPKGWEWVKFQIAKFVGGGVWGYEKEDFSALRASRIPLDPRTGELKPFVSKKKGIGYGAVGMIGLREPNTFAYALCDSPVGLLSMVCSALRRKSPGHKLSDTEVIDVTQLAWLPGPEAGTRYWAGVVTEIEKLDKAKTTGSRVAVTIFGSDGDANGYICPAWGSGKHNIVSAQRVPGKSGLIARDKMHIVASGIRGLAREIDRVDGRLRVRSLDAVAIGSGEDLIPEEDEGGHGMQLDVESPDTIVAVEMN